MAKVYLTPWAISSLVVILLAGAWSYVIDPYGLYWHIQISGFNQQKEGVRNKIRFVKALELPLRKPVTVLMGSSRVHDGMNPEHPLLQEYAPVYNLGVDMNRIHETLVLLRHATENAPIKRVVLGLDLFMFNAKQQSSPDFDETLIGRQTNIADYLVRPIFSMTSMYDAVRTVKVSFLTPDRREFLPNGYRPQAFYGLKSHSSAHYYSTWIFLTPKPQQAKYYADISISDTVYSDFESIIAFCSKKGIDLHLYITPAHANLDGEGIRALGKWELREDWKRRVTEIAFIHNVPLWDFSGYNSVTTEPVRTTMKYYWDSSHFTETVGNWIVMRLFANDESIPDGFGVQLSPSNIEAHLEQIRIDRERYYQFNRPELVALYAEYKHIINGGALDLQRIKNMY